MTVHLTTYYPSGSTSYKECHNMREAELSYYPSQAMYQSIVVIYDDEVISYARTGPGDFQRIWPPKLWNAIQIGDHNVQNIRW